MVGDAEQIVTIPVPVSRNYFVYGGSVYGNDTHAPEVYHYFGGANKSESRSYGLSSSPSDDSDNDQQDWEDEGDADAEVFEE